MIHTVNTGTKTVAFVKVPEGVILTRHIVIPCESVNGFYHEMNVKLSCGNWQYIGLSHELTEEQCAEIVDEDEIPWQGLAWYKNYLDRQTNRQIDTALDSFRSLMASIPIYEKNPLGDDPQQAANMDYWDDDVKGSNIKKWQEAENVSGTWAVLIKDNNLKETNHDK